MPRELWEQGHTSEGTDIMSRPMPDPLTFERVWMPYIYLYGVGGLCFFSGLALAYKSGAFNPKRAEHRRWIGVLLFGFFWYAGLHAAGILAATNI